MTEFNKREIENLIAGKARPPRSVCPDCGHAPIMHHEEHGCIVCFWLISNKDAIVPHKPTRVCKTEFKFKLSLEERTQAMIANPQDFEQEEICASCGMYWMQHHGYLCPSGDSTFTKLFPKGKEQA